MRQTPIHLRELVEPAVTVLGFELVGIEFVSQAHSAVLRVYIDAADGITADDCQRVSHQISGSLDVDDPIPGHYTLEVSSPGLDRPLFTLEHFERFAGCQARIRLNAPMEGRRNFAGVLLGVNNDTVLIREGDLDYSLALGNIGKARLIPDI